MKTIVISGANSMLGRALCEKAIACGDSIIVLLRKKSNDPFFNHSKIKILYATIESYQQLDVKNMQADIFYHFAWYGSRSDERNNINIQMKNIEHIKAILSLMKKFQCKQFIGAGSQAEYGLNSKKITSINAVNPTTPYGLAKYSFGRLMSYLTQEEGIDFQWARIFSIYGPNDNKQTLVMHCIEKFLSGESPLLAHHERYWDYLYSKDAANALYLMGTKGKNQSIYNIASGKSYALYDYVLEIRNAINTQIPILFSDTTHEQSPMTHLQADIDNLTKDTGFIPQYTFAHGINETIEWYKNSGAK